MLLTDTVAVPLITVFPTFSYINPEEPKFVKSKDPKGCGLLTGIQSDLCAQSAVSTDTLQRKV